MPSDDTNAESQQIINCSVLPDLPLASRGASSEIAHNNTWRSDRLFCEMTQSLRVHYDVLKERWGLRGGGGGARERGREREREKEGARERERETKTERERQTDREGVSKLVFCAQSTSAVISGRERERGGGWGGREGDKDIDRERQRERDRERDRETDRQTDRQTGRQRGSK